MRKIIVMLTMLLVGASVFAETTVNVLTKSQKALIINQFDLELVSKEKIPSEKLTPSMAAAIVVAAEYEQVYFVIDDDDDAAINFIQLDDDGIYVYRYKYRS